MLQGWSVRFTTVCALGLVIFAGFAGLAPRAGALDNGLARTPPMGWNSWNTFPCIANETLIKQMADAMVSSGMRDVGYQFINLDDCWQSSREADGTIVADPELYPSGIKALADYVHARGLKLGVYSDRSEYTCQRRPGSYGYEVLDANTYAAWGVDYLKYDNCFADSYVQEEYELMRDALAHSGRDIVYSVCAWQFLPWMPGAGNLWRTTGDIIPWWGSIVGNIDTNATLAQYAGPGAWNDPDMLEVGNGNLTETENRAHFSMWAIMAAPLITGNDLRNMSTAVRDILTNGEVIAVDQDPLGKQGVRVRDDGELEVWSKEISGTDVRAVALFNQSRSSVDITVNWSEVGLGGSASVRDLWAHADRGSFAGSYTATVPAHGVVMLQVVGDANPPDTTASTVGGDGGCAVAPTHNRAAWWLLVPVAMLLQRRRRGNAG